MNKPRPGFFNRDDPTLKEKAAIFVSKQRERKVGDIELKWKGDYVRFEEEPEAM
jgi:replicative DNA helicase